MAEYIEREAAIALASGGCHPANVAKEIAQLPAADVRPVVRGEWFDVGSLSCRCSVCGCKNDRVRNFCPNCGAVMKGAER